MMKEVFTFVLYSEKKWHVDVPFQDDPPSYV